MCCQEVRLELLTIDPSFHLLLKLEFAAERRRDGVQRYFEDLNCVHTGQLETLLVLFAPEFCIGTARMAPEKCIQAVVPATSAC